MIIYSDPTMALCRRCSGEYVRVLKYIGESGRLKVISLNQRKTEGLAETRAITVRVAEILGFKSGEVRFVFHPGWGARGLAYPWDFEVELGYNTNIETIVHELTHIMCYDETTLWRGINGRKRTSVHNEGFAAWLVAAMDNVLEYAEELGIRIFTIEDVMSR